MGGVKRAAAVLLPLLIAVAGCKNPVVDVIGQQYDAAGGFDPKFVVSNANPLVNTTVTFTNATLAEVKAVHWDFGDGATEDNISTPVHQYSAAGLYTVTMTATSAHGTSRSFRMEVRPVGTQPLVVIQAPTAAWVGNAPGSSVQIKVTVVDTYSGNLSTPGVASVSMDIGASVGVYTHSLTPAETAQSRGSGFVFTYNWDTRAVADGSYAIHIVATDADPQTGTVDVSMGVDNTVPTITSVSVASGNPTTTTASVSVSAAVNDGAGSGPSLMAFSNDGTTWSDWETYALTKSAWVIAPATDGPHTVYAKVRDVAGNESTVKNTSISLDTQPPTGSFTIEGGASATKKTSVALTISATDAGSSVAEMRFSNDNSSWSTPEPYAGSKSWPLAAGNDGPRTVYAQFKDANNQWSSAVISASVILDRAAPVISSTSFSKTGWLGSGATVTLNITTASAETGLTAGTITVNSRPTSNFRGSGTSWQVDYQAQSGDPNQSAFNQLPISVVLTDWAGNSTAPYTASPALTPAVDTVAPSVSTASFSNTGWLKAGSTVTLNVTLGGSETGLTLSTSTINDVAVTNFGGSGTTYHVDYSVASGNNNRGQNALPVSVVFADQAGNAVTVPAPASTPGVDTVAPAISSTSFNVTTWLKAGSVARLNITTSSSESGLTAGAVSVNGVSVASTFGGSGTSWHVDYTVSGGDANQSALNQMPISVVLTDQAGNSSTTYTTHPASTPAVDTVAPVVTGASFSSAVWLKSGSTVNLNFTTSTSETGLAAGAITANTKTTTGFGGSGTSWHATYTVATPDPNQSALNQMPISVSVIDQAGNVSAAYTTTPAATPAVDTVPPVVTNASFSSVGWMRSGSSVTLNFTTSVSETGLTAGSITANGKATTGFGGSGTSWHVTYTVAGGDPQTALNQIPISVSVIDPAGNSSSAYTTKPALTPGVDTVAPVAASILLSAGNSQVSLLFPEGVYGDALATLAVQSGSATIMDQTTGQAATILGVVHSAGNASPVYSVNWPLGAPSSGDVIVLQVVSNKIYDIAGNAAVGGTQAIGTAL